MRAADLGHLSIFVLLAWSLVLPFESSLARGQVVPWSCRDKRIMVSLWSADALQATQMRFAPDGSLWVIELRGRLLRLVETDTGVKSQTMFEFRDKAWSADVQMGATSLAFALDFTGDDGTLYVAHNWDEVAHRRGAISRVMVRDGVVADVQTVFGPVTSAGAHQVARLVVDDKGDLLASVGDVWQPFLSQREDDCHGKVLRFDAERLSRADQPVPYRIVAKGLRSPFAMVRRPSDGLVVVADNGPDVDDMLFVVSHGANYGWGSSGPRTTEHRLYTWHETVAPDGMCFYEPGTGPKRWPWPKTYHGDLFICLFKPALLEDANSVAREGPLTKVRQVLRMRLSNEGQGFKVKEVEPFLIHAGGGSECPVDMAVGPAGDIFLLTFDTDPTRASRIYRLRFVE